jgi:RND family efflux transporter MFP subunit
MTRTSRVKSQLPTPNFQGECARVSSLGVGSWKLGVLAIMLCAAMGCSKQAAEEVETKTVVPVKMVPAATGSIRGVVHATGVVSPSPGAELVVIAPGPARIAEIPRAEGDRVQQGDVLVRFEIPNMAAEVQRQVAEVQRALASLANAKANQTRAHDLFDRGVAARKDVEDADRAVADAEAAVAQAEASRAAANTTAARAVVRATFDGIIAKRFHNPGDLVDAAAGDPVLRVIDPRRLEVIASVPLADSSRIVIGAPAHLVAGPAGSPEVRLKVISRPAAVDPGTATIPVRLAFNGPTNFPTGTPVQVDIDAEQHMNVVLIPAPALVREGEETAVFVAKGDKAERRVVAIGLTDEMDVEIVSGVKEGEMVIVDGQAGLPDGATITREAAEDDDEEPAEPPADAGGDSKDGK